MSWFLFLACTKPELPALDLTEVLGPGEVRAGVVTDDAALFGGIGAEGLVGDLKIYNDRVAFIVQSTRSGGFMSTYGGTVIDADMVRDGVGRDLVMEWAPNMGFGRFVDPDRVWVASDGRDGSACIRVVGHGGSFEYLGGAVGIETVDLGLHVVTDYILQPDSWLLEVRSTVTATDGEATFQPGDILSGAREIADPWEPGVGLEAPSTQEGDLAGWIAQDNRVAIAIVAPDTAGSGAASIIANLMMMEMAFADAVTLQEGESTTYVRHYGVGPDMDTFREGPEISGVVEAPDGPVANARVHVLVDGAPWSMGVTDDEGAYTVHAPEGAEIVADGRGGPHVVDLPDGAEDYSPYATPALRERALRSMTEGGPTSEPPRGRGLGELGEPAWLQVSSDGPFELRLAPELRDEVDPRISRDYGATRAWSGDGDMSFAMAPGTYELLVHRGLRFEVHAETIELVAGETLSVDAPLEQAYSHDGYLLSDPHMHAAPSSDGKISMEERLLTCAGTGLQVHYATDHDHIVDYTPLVETLGLELVSITGSEVSPFSRGHLNVFPLESDPTKPNGGGWLWFNDPMETTEAQFAFLRERFPGALIQANHPLGMGLAAAAEWDPGVLGEPDYWSSDFDLVEVLNQGRVELEFFFDLVNRGLDPVPTGTSDSHEHGGMVGLSATFVADLEEGDVVLTRGPFLDLSLEDGALDVVAMAPSWIVVDRLLLYRNGELVETVEGTQARFSLATEQDAWFVVIAEGDTPMQPVTGHTPWAMSGVFKVDLEGDGWEPPLPPLEEL